MKYVVVDLEMNPVSREFRDVRRKMNEEVIEFGAVRLDEWPDKKTHYQSYGDYAGDGGWSRVL